MDVSKLGKDTSKAEDDDKEETVSASQANNNSLGAAIELIERQQKKAGTVGSHKIPYSQTHDLQQKTLNVIQGIKTNTKPTNWFRNGISKLIWVIVAIFLTLVTADIYPKVKEWCVEQPK